MKPATLSPMLLGIASLVLSAAEPDWWLALHRAPVLESRFRQDSESLVFGKLSRQGSLILARGGRLRVAYDGGLTVTCDGRQVVQVDPDTRTAQRMLLAEAQREFPLLNLLTDPARIRALYLLEAAGKDALKLVPRGAGLPPLVARGRQGLLRSLEWTDATGAQQTFELLGPQVRGSVDAKLFKPVLPIGTRWATPND
jgi:outer membrane lipoprotein-sorting protein